MMARKGKQGQQGRIVFEGRNFSRCVCVGCLVTMRLQIAPRLFPCPIHPPSPPTHYHYRRYEITSRHRLGGGHFGTIFAVREVRTGRECVVKLYRRCVRVCMSGGRGGGGRGVHMCYHKTMRAHSHVHTCSSQREAALDVAHEKTYLIMARRCQCKCVCMYVGVCEALACRDPRVPFLPPTPTLTLLHTHPNAQSCPFSMCARPVPDRLRGRPAGPAAGPVLHGPQPRLQGDNGAGTPGHEDSNHVPSRD